MRVPGARGGGASCCRGGRAGRSRRRRPNLPAAVLARYEGRTLEAWLRGVTAHVERAQFQNRATVLHARPDPEKLLPGSGRALHGGAPQYAGVVPMHVGGRGRVTWRIERHRGDAKADRKDAGMKSSIPYGHDERLVRHRKRARQMHGIGAPERKLLGEVSSVTADRRRQLDRPGCAPKLGPALLCLCKPIPVEVMVPVRTSERGPNLGIGQPARYGRVATVPQRDCEFRPRLLHEQLHERAGVEVDQGHLSVVVRPPMGRPADVDGAGVVRRPLAVRE